MSSMTRTISRGIVHDHKRSNLLKKLAIKASVRKANALKYPPVARIKDVKHGKRPRYVAPITILPAKKNREPISKRIGSKINKYFALVQAMAARTFFGKKVARV